MVSYQPWMVEFMLFQVRKPGGMLAEALGTLILRAAGIGLTFLMTFCLARVLGPYEYGLYSAAMSMSILLATLAPLGSDRTLVRSLSVVRSHAEAGAITALTHCGAALAAGCFLAGICGICVLSGLLSLSHRWVLIAAMAGITLIPLVLTYLRQWVAIPLVGAGPAVFPEQILLPPTFFAVLSVAALCGVPLNAFSAAVIYAGVMLLVWYGSLHSAAIRETYAAAARYVPRVAAVRSHLRGGLPFLGFSIGCTMLQRSLPLVIVTTCGAAATARFSVAVQYAALAGIPLSVINLCMIPRCARSYRDGEQRAVSHLIRKAATLTFALACGIALLAWLALPLFIRLLGPDYGEIDQILPVLLCAAVIESAAGSSVPVMQTMHLEHVLGRAMFAFVPVQTGLIYVGSAVSGPLGGALGYLVSRTLWTALILVIIYRWLSLLSLPYVWPRQLQWFRHSVLQDT